MNWNEEVLGFARMNGRFLGVVERAFDEFVGSGKKTQVLPHMPPEKRKFVCDVCVSLVKALFSHLTLFFFKIAAAYRIDTQLVDQEPHRRCSSILPCLTLFD